MGLKVFFVSILLFQFTLTITTAMAAQSCKLESLCKNITFSQDAPIAYQGASGLIRNFSKMSEDEIKKNIFANPNYKNFNSPQKLLAWTVKEARVRKIFKQVKEIESEIILQSKSLSNEQKKIFLERIRTVSFTYTESSFNDPLSYNAYYYSKTNAVEYNPVNLELPILSHVFTLAHEVAHSIGPKFYPNEHPSQKSCLASLGVRDEQMNEAFSDLMASHVVAKFKAIQPIEAVMDFLIEGCNLGFGIERLQYKGFDSEDNYKGECGSYPATRLRIESIFLGNSTIADAVGCSDAVVQPETCSF